MLRTLLSLGTIAAGVYYLDPNLGRRRRALLRDRVSSSAGQLRLGVDKAVRDLSQRAEGFAAELRPAIQGEAVSDRVLVERVRSKMGRYVSHPSAIHVDAYDGQVVLSGPILADEVEPFVAAIRRLPGVESVDNELESHRTTDKVSALQGGKQPPGEHWNIAEQNRAPATRLVAALAGGWLIAFGLTRRFPIACAVGTAGLGLCAAAWRKSGSGYSSRHGWRESTEDGSVPAAAKGNRAANV